MKARQTLIAVLLGVITGYIICFAVFLGFLFLNTITAVDLNTLVWTFYLLLILILIPIVILFIKNARSKKTTFANVYWLSSIAFSLIAGITGITLPIVDLFLIVAINKIL